MSPTRFRDLASGPNCSLNPMSTVLGAFGDPPFGRLAPTCSCVAAIRRRVAIQSMLPSPACGGHVGALLGASTRPIGQIKVAQKLAGGVGAPRGTATHAFHLYASPCSSTPTVEHFPPSGQQVTVPSSEASAVPDTTALPPGPSLAAYASSRGDSRSSGKQTFVY